MVRDIVLTPLTLDEVGQLIADSVREERALVEPLARLVYEKSSASRRRPRPTPTGSR
jgi:predicted ATPase